MVKKRPESFHRIMLTCLMAAAMLALILGYLPGLHGTFLFDDFANLPSLGAFGPIRSGNVFLRYITSGHADPTGRPVALISFLADARDWPADPFLFKRDNVILHGINAILLGVVLAWLGRLHGQPRARADLAGAIAASFWALHPFFVSTVLYIVQREAMLPATFTLLGMLCWLQARHSYGQHPATSCCWIILGIGSCTALAALSKANGLLLPLLVLVCESTLPPASPGFRHRLNLALMPLALGTIALVVWTGVSSIGQGPIPVRGWTVDQRLITEPSILFDYLAQLWLIKPSDSSLLHDDMQVARSLWDPWYTGLAILGCVSLIAAAIKLRRRTPLVAMIILFFFAGHIMESTSLALELYFDHRNYLPAMPMFWPLAMMITGVRSRWIAGSATMAGLLALTSLTEAQTKLWGTPREQAIAWADLHPASARAQAFAAQMEAATGFPNAARLRIDAAARRFSDEPQIALNVIDIHCETGGVQKEDVDYAAAAFAKARREPGPLLLSWFKLAIDKSAGGDCPSLRQEDLRRILDNASSNPRIGTIAGRRQDIDHVRGLAAIASNDPEQAAVYFRQSLIQDPNPATALSQAAILGSAGHPYLGLSHLQYFSQLPRTPRHKPSDGMPWIHDMVLAKQHYWENEINHLSETLARDAGKAK